MKRFICLNLLWLICTPSLIFSQTIQISGRVNHSKTLEPLSGVSVGIKGSSEKGAITDQNGDYSIAASPDATLIFSFVGLKVQEVEVYNQSEIDVLMEPDIITAEEVLFYGYGTILKTDITGSMTKINGEELLQIPVNSFESAIQGKITGLQLTHTSGKPGEAINLRIRGSSSLAGSNQPLLVVDGIIIENQSFGDPANHPLNPLTSINPNEIESIQVLKDASATAIYGARASNGVIIIHTKTGHKTEEFKVSAGYSITTSQETNRLDMLNGEEYMELMTESLVNGFGFDSLSAYTFLMGYLGIDTVLNYDWQDEIFQKALSHNTYLNIFSNKENLQYYAGMSYSNQEGILTGTGFERITGRLNINHQINKIFDVTAKISLSRTYLDRVDQDNSVLTPVQMIANPSVIAPYLDNGDINPNVLYYNTLQGLQNESNTNIVDRTMGMIKADANILSEQLEFTSQLSIDKLNQIEESRYSSESVNGMPSGKGTNRTVNNMSYMFDNYFTLSQTFLDFISADVVFGTSFQEIKYNRIAVGGAGYPNDEFKDLDAAAENTFFGSLNRTTTYISYFARGNLKILNKYLLSASFRSDGSSKFGPDNRYANFYSVGTGWLLSSESFIQDNIPIISYLKPRISFGITGNADIQDYGYMNLASPRFYAGNVGLMAGQIGYGNLSWENSQQLDIGLEYGLFKNRIGGEVDYYLKTTTDLLLNRPVYAVYGYSSILENVGRINNKGVEFSIFATPITGEFKWNLAFNLTFNKNEVAQLDEPITYDFNRVEEEKPIGFFYLPEYIGVDPDNGDALYYTETGDTTNNYLEADYRDVGNPNPKYFGGIQNNFRYKNFDLNIFIQFVGDRDVYLGHGEYMMSNGNVLDNQTKDQLNRWQKPGDNTDIPQARIFGENGTGKSSRYISDASYVRIKDITLGYSLPKDLIQKYLIKELRLYISLYNIFTLTKYKGYDPEVSSALFSTSTTAYNVVQGIDMYSTPQAKSITFGINVSF